MHSEVFFIIICLAFSAFFSAVEIAFMRANRLHIMLQKRKSTVSGAIIAAFAQKPSLFITCLLIGNTLSLVLYGIFMAKILDIPIAEFIQSYLQLTDETTLEISVLVVQSFVSTLIVLAFAEFLPKSFGMISPNKLLDFFALPLQIIYKLFYPLVYISASLSELIIIRVLKQPSSKENPVVGFGIEDLSTYIENLQKTGGQAAMDSEIFNNAMELRRIKVRDCMVPRTEMIAVDVSDGAEKLREVFIESGHSKIPVFEDSVDNVIGYCHCLDLFKKPKAITEFLHPFLIVTESMQAGDLILKFTAERKSIALVVDEFGGTAGIITLEDVIEEIFGEIDDEYDEIVNDVHQIDENTYEVSARSEVDALNEKYGWNIPEGDYETLAGFLIYANENIPEIQETVKIDRFEFTVISKQDAKLDKLLLRISESEAG